MAEVAVLRTDKERNVNLIPGRDRPAALAFSHACGVADTGDQVWDVPTASSPAIIKTLKSDDPKDLNRGLRALATIEKGLLMVLDVEMQHAKTGGDAATAFELGRTWMQCDLGQ